MSEQGHHERNQACRVLVVEDEPRLRELLLRAIPDMGFPTTAARSAEEALRVLSEEGADILVVDLNLPGMSGLDFLAKVRERRLPVAAIVLTGFGDLESARAAIHLDVVDFLTKPCPLGDLERALDRARAWLERAAAPTERVVLPAAAVEREPGVEPRRLEDLEREHILAALERHEGNRAATAEELGISLRTLYYRLSEYQKQGHL